MGKKAKRGKPGIIKAGIIDSFNVAQSVTIDVIMVKTKENQFLSMSSLPHCPLIFESEAMATMRANDANLEGYQVVRGTVTFQEKPKEVKVDK